MAITPGSPGISGWANGIDQLVESGRLSEAELSATFVEAPALAVNSLTGWVHLDGAGLSTENTASQNATILQAAFDAAGPKGTVYVTEKFQNATIPIEAGVVTVTDDQVTLLGSISRSEYDPRLQGVGSGFIITAKGFGFNAQGVNLLGDVEVNDSPLEPDVSGILFDRSDGTGTATLANIDGKVRDCGFMCLKQAVQVNGRNLDVVDNMFSWCVRGIQVDRYETQECRGFRFIGNRFHNIGGNQTTDTGGVYAVAIDITSAAAWGIQVEANTFDGGGLHFYRGPLDRTTITGNSLYRMSGIGIDVIDRGSAFWSAWSITGNIFEGVYNNTWDSEDLAAASGTPDYFIRTASSILYGAITGNAISRTRYDAINSPEISYTTIAGNTIIDPARYSAIDGVSSDGINITTGAYLLVADNVVRATAAGLYRYAYNVGAASLSLLDSNLAANFATGKYNYTHATTVARDADVVQLLPRAATGVKNNTLFVDSSGNVLKFKDNSGVVKTVDLT